MEDDKIQMETVSIDLAKDTAVNMALRILFTQIFTPYSIVSIDGKQLSKDVIDEISGLIDRHIRDLQLAFSDFLLKGKCYLYKLHYINPNSMNFKERKHWNPQKEDMSIASHTQLKGIMPKDGGKLIQKRMLGL